MSQRSAVPTLSAPAPRPLRLRLTAASGTPRRSANRHRAPGHPDPEEPRKGVSLRRDLVRHVRHDGGLWILAESHLWPDGPEGTSLGLAMAAYAGPGQNVLAINADPLRAALAPDAAWYTLPRFPSGAVDSALAVEAIGRYDPGIVLVGRTSPGAPAVPAQVVDALLAAASGLVIVDEGASSLVGSALALLTDRPALFVHRTVPRPITTAHHLSPGLGYLAGTPLTLASIAYQSVLEPPASSRRAPRQPDGPLTEPRTEP